MKTSRFNVRISINRQEYRVLKYLSLHLIAKNFRISIQNAPECTILKFQKNQKFSGEGTFLRPPPVGKETLPFHTSPRRLRRSTPIFGEIEHSESYAMVTLDRTFIGSLGLCEHLRTQASLLFPVYDRPLRSRIYDKF